MNVKVLTYEQIETLFREHDDLYAFGYAIEQAVLQSERVQALREALRAAAEYIGDRSAGSSRFWELYDAAMEKQP